MSTTLPAVYGGTSTILAGSILSNAIITPTSIWVTSSSTANSYTATTTTSLPPTTWVDGTGYTINNVDIQSLTLGLLRGEGVVLNDGGRLKIIDDEPGVVYKHDDGSEVSHPLRLTHNGNIDLTKHLPDILPGTILKLPEGNYLEIGKDGEITKEHYINARDKVIDVVGGGHTLYESLAYCQFKEIYIPDGAHTHASLVLPNKVRVNIFPDDHIEIDESDGRQIYKTQPIRDFNKYLNASDLLEEFIGYCAEQKLTRNQFAELPVSLFIYWLIVQAAQADGDPTEEVLPLLTSAVKGQKLHDHRCGHCGKFLSRKFEENNINFCNIEHFEKQLARIS